jgi:hypothetical protein
MQLCRFSKIVKFNVLLKTNIVITNIPYKKLIEVAYLMLLMNNLLSAVTPPCESQQR